jgi:hypothetical protein
VAPDFTSFNPGYESLIFGLRKIFQSVGDLASLSRPATENILVFSRSKSPAFIVHPVPKEGR